MSRAAAKLPPWIDFLLLPLLNLIAAFLISGVLIALMGENPFEALGVMLYGALGFSEAIGYTLYYSTNFIFTGLAVALAYQAGLFNIGGEGQAVAGGIGLAATIFLLDGAPALIMIPAAIFGGALFGAAWAYIPALLQVKRGSHIVITTIMFNFIAFSLLSYLLVGPWHRVGGQMPESEDFAGAAKLPHVYNLFAEQGLLFDESPLNLSILVALIAVWGVWLLLYRTRFGYDVRVAGKNAAAARYAGIPAGRTTILAMALSGALAGMMGINELMGEQHRLVDNFTLGYGYVGIAVAFMGRAHPVGVLMAALLFGVLYQGGTELSFEMGFPQDLIVMVQGLVILFSGAMEYLFRKPVEALLVKRSSVAEGQV